MLLRHLRILLCRAGTFICGLTGHDKMELIEKYHATTDRRRYRQGGGWSVRVDIVTGKWRCSCCHNVQLLTVETETRSYKPSHD